MTANEAAQPTATITGLDFNQCRFSENLKPEAVEARLGDDRLREAIASSQSVRLA